MTRERTIYLDSANCAVPEGNARAVRQMTARYGPDNRRLSWRMVWRNQTAAVFQSTGETGTTANLFVADSWEECEREAERLGLTLEPLQSAAHVAVPVQAVAQP